jgi:hypothetical protein
MTSSVLDANTKCYRKTFLLVLWSSMYLELLYNVGMLEGNYANAGICVRLGEREKRAHPRTYIQNER